jgi:hypothetical protein
VQAAAAPAQSPQLKRTLSGIIYFTNDTPRNLDTFPVELFTHDRRRRVLASKANAHGGFELTGIKPGKYVLKLTWPPERCELWYRVDLRKESKTSATVVMDAACSGGSHVRDLQTN